tara:strand:- start:18 stop:1697 length:1680 start_codon:yes stop_codon:yes gene_type:complete
LKVVVQSAAGVDSVKTITTHYTVSGVGSSVGGAVVFVTAPVLGETVSIILDPELTQLTDYSTGGAFPAQSHEDALDKQLNVNKRTRDLVDRSLNLPDGDVDGSGAYDANSNRITDLATPTGANDAATKSYTDSVVAAAVIDPSVTVTPYAATILDDANAAAARSTLGGGSKGVAIFQDATSADVMTELGMTTFSQDLLTGNGNAQAWRDDLLTEAQIPLANVLDNSDFQVWQWGTSFTSTVPYAGATNDDSYIADQWKLLSDGNDIADVSRTGVNDVPQGAKSGITVTQNATANTKWGIWQVLESRVCEPLAGLEVTLSVYIKTGTDDLEHFELLAAEWSGTADDIGTSDPISAWNNAAVRPSFAGDWAFISGSQGIAVSSGPGWERVYVTFTMPASPNNVGILLCTKDNSFSAGASVQISGFKLEIGSTMTRYESKPYSVELAQCQRFYAKTFQDEVFPKDNVGFIGALGTMVNEWGGSSYAVALCWSLPVEMLKNPATVSYNPGSGTAGRFRSVAGVDRSVNTVLVDDQKKVMLSAAGSAGGIAEIYYVQATADARL